MLNDYTLKALLDEGAIIDYSAYRNDLLKNRDFEALKRLDTELKDDNYFKVVQNAYNRLKQRRNSISKRIWEMLHYSNKGNVWFITLTFRDEILENTSEKTRREYVSQFLKDNCTCYVANIDYGHKNKYIGQDGKEHVGTEREHYHAVVNKLIPFSKWFDRFGAMYGEKLSRDNHSVQKVAEYTAKLTNHAMKQNTLARSPIFSRDMGKRMKRKVYAPRDIEKQRYEIMKIINQYDCVNKLSNNRACPFKVARQVKGRLNWLNYLKTLKN